MLRDARKLFWWGVSLAIILTIPTRAHTFTWDRSPDEATGKVLGYKLYYSAQSFSSVPPDVATNPAFKSVSVGTNQMTVTINDLTNGQTYYMTVIAQAANGQLSPPSNILPYTAGGPIVVVTSPTNNLVVNSTQEVTISAQITSAATITKVEFFDNDVLFATRTAAPFTANRSFPTGTHVLTVKATDVNNLVGTSGPTTVTAPTRPSPPTNLKIVQ
jgi:hypothetical protein